MAQNLPARSGSATARQGTAVWSPLAEMGELYARMSQLMLLPASADKDKVTASLSDGVLTVTVPNSEDQNSHRVEVTSG